MSKENRKRMYDKLVAAERYEHISDRLKAEFGDPTAKDELGKQVIDINYSVMSKKQLKQLMTPELK